MCKITGMKTYNFPYIASALGLILTFVIMRGSQLAEDGETALPLLTLLIVNEFAFFVTAIGTYIGINNTMKSGIKPAYVAMTVLCAILCIRFIFSGIELWPL